MEREQIIKALECLTGEEVMFCRECIYNKVGAFSCRKELAKDALALIKAQAVDYTELDEKYRNLFWENERISQSLANSKLILANSKADTVRKMQNELKKTFSAICKGEMGDLFRIIDQIAKEMLEGENGR